MTDDIELNDPVALFEDITKKTLGVVTYEGDLHGHMPLEMHFDTETRSLSVLFNNGAERPLCVDMSKDDIAQVAAKYKELHENGAEVMMGLVRVDADANLAKPHYRVPVLMM